MKTTKLQQQDIEQALAAARKMLVEEASWITKSALIERAYFIWNAPNKVPQVVC